MALASAPLLAKSLEKKQLVHHVFFWLKNPESKEDFAKLVEGITSLKKIEKIKGIQIGKPANTPKRDIVDSSYSLSLLLKFDTIEGHDSYQVEPIHKKFVEQYSHLWGKVQIYDAMDI